MACLICGVEFAPDHRRRYCSVPCRRTAEEARRRLKNAETFAGVSPMGDIATREQLLELLTVAARAGHVPAMKLLLEELRRDDPDASTDFIDELARKREKAR